MAKRTRPNSRKLTPEERETIADWVANHPETTDQEAAMRYGCTPHQVRYIRRLIDDGIIIVRRTVLSDRLAAETAAREIADPVEAVREELELVIGQIRSSPDMPVAVRVKLLKEATAALKTLKGLSLADHLRMDDIGVLTTLIRMFRPDASDLDCITILETARDTWKTTRA